MEREIPFLGICDYCGRKGEKATKENLNGIIFFWPDLKWICAECLGWKHINQVNIAQ